MARDAYHHGDLRRALLDAARRLVAREGADRVSLRGIAREAGVSPSAPYHHFEDRETLLAGVAAEGFRGLEGAMADGAASVGDEDPLERLRAVGAAYVRFALENPEIFRLMFSGLVSDRSRAPELEEASADTWKVLEDLLGGPEEGGARPGGADGAGEPAGRGDAAPGRPPREVGLAAWSLVHGLAFLLVEGMLDEEAAEAGADALIRDVTRVLGRGLGAYAGPGER